MTYPGAVRAELVLTVKIRKLHAREGPMVCHRHPSPSFAILRHTEQKVYLSHARR